jgi:hypothetical protein
MSWEHSHNRIFPILGTEHAGIVFTGSDMETSPDTYPSPEYTIPGPSYCRKGVRKFILIPS